MRRNTIIWFFLCAFVVLLFAIISYKTLFGWWTLRVLGFENQTFNWDPGGAYLGAGIPFYDQRYIANSNWAGHPGITLMFLIQIVTRGLYTLSILFGTTVSYAAYVAKNIFWIILIMKIVISILYLISAYLIYIFTLELMNNKDIAFLASLSYLTTYPVLAYFNNISPEPLMVIFTLMAIFFIFKYKKTPFNNKDRNLKPFIYIALSAFLTACSLGTKMVFGIPTAILIYLFILIEKHSMYIKKIRFGFARRIIDSGLYILFLMLFIIPVYWKVDFNIFFKYWFNYSPGSPIYESTKSWGINIISNLGYLVAFLFMSIIEKISSAFLPRLNYFGVFNIAESIFLPASVFGIILFWKKEPKRRLILIWIVVFNILITLIYIYRTFWHYFMLQLAFLAIFFAYFVYNFVNKITGISVKIRYVLSILLIFYCHAFSIYLFINLRLADMKEYKVWQPYYNALRKIDYDEKIGVINSPGLDEIFGNLFYYMPKESVSQYKKEFDKYFVYLDYKTAQSLSGANNIRFLIDHNTSQTILTETGN